jgi:Spy/CpxP family protein refolding chaperone
MKKVVLVTFIFVCSLILGSALTFAQKDDRNKMKRLPFGRIADELGLTEQQKMQIKQIYQTQEEKIKALRQEMHQIRHQLSNQGRDGTFNEPLVIELASRQAELTKQMIIEKERTKALVFAVLTPEQREKVPRNFAERFKRRRQITNQE